MIYLNGSSMASAQTVGPTSAQPLDSSVQKRLEILDGPWFDIRDYGANARFPILNATASTADASNLAVVTLSMPNDFKDGESIDITGAGPATSQIAPAAPSVLSASVKGSATYSYQCVAVDSENGLYPGAVGTVNDGPNSFTAEPIPNSSIERIGSTLNIEVANNFVVGPPTAPTVLIVEGAIPADLNGEYVIASATSRMVTAKTGLTFHGTEKGTQPGTSLVYPVVSISCPPVNLVSRNSPRDQYLARTIQYAVYGDSSGSMTFIGMTSLAPVDSADNGVTYNQNRIDDWGPILSVGIIPPTGIPRMPPAAPVRRMYQGIVSSHLGPNRIVVSPAPRVRFDRQTVYHDDGPAILAAAKAAERNGGGSVLIPPATINSPNASYQINYPLVLPRLVNFIVASRIIANATITLGSATSVTGVFGSSNPCFPQFSQRNYACFDGTASPQIYLPEDADSLDGIGFLTSSNRQNSLLVTGSQQTISNCAFATPQTLSTSVIVQSAATALHFTNVSFLDSSTVFWPGPFVPALWFRSDNLTGVPGMILMDGVNSFAYRGIMIDTSGLNKNSETDYNFTIGEDQAPSTPLIMLYGGGYIQNVSLSGAVMDSTLAPALANWSTNVNDVRLNYITTSGGAPQVTGSLIPGLTEQSSRPATFPLGQNTDFHANLVANIIHSAASAGAEVSGETLQAQPLIISNGGSYPIAVAYPPADVTLGQTTGGSLVADMQYNVAISTVGPNGGDSSPSTQSITLRSPNSAITVNWTQVPGAYGYDVFLNSRKINQIPIHPDAPVLKIVGREDFGGEPALDGTGLPLLDVNGIYARQMQTFKLTQPNSGQFAGVGTLANGTFTHRFAMPYRFAPVCTANDITNLAPVRPVATATTLTVSGIAGDSIAFICVGNPE
jgi:hypothetical protein